MNLSQQFLNAATALTIQHWCENCQRETRHAFVKDEGKYEIYVCCVPSCGCEYRAAVR